MRYLFLIFLPLFAFGQIAVTPISHYPTTSIKPQLQLISQDTPNTPVIYKKFNAGALRSWIDSSAMDSAGCQSKLNCDSTGTGNLVRQTSPTFTGIVVNTGRDSTVGNIKTGGTLSSGGNIFSGAYLVTGTPNSGTSGPWKLGIEITGTSCHLDTTKYIQLDVSGTAIKLSTCQ